jgi:hypothetical protein
MNDDPDPKYNSAAITLMWLAIGLAPILILLLLSSSNEPSHMSGAIVLLVFCVGCNLLGGFGCARNVKDSLLRSVLGLILSGCFFVICVIVAVYQACSNMRF